jgi:hypothetical protein
MNIDEQLRTALRDDRHAAPSWPDPVSRVEEGITRRRRRRLVVQTVGLATALVVTLSVVTLQGHPSTAPADGWIIDSTADGPRSAPPDMQRRSPRPDRAPCPVDALGPVEWIVQSAPWGNSTGFGIRNIKQDRCTLSGTPTLIGTDVDTGVRVPVPSAELPPGNDTKVRQFPATIDAGELARIEIKGQAVCQPWQTPRSYRDLVLVFQGHELPLPNFRHLDSVCGAQVSPWFVEPPLEYAPLVVSLDAPTTLQRGTDFTYTVNMLNASRRPYRLPACPSYQITPTQREGEWRTLNCQLTEIPPHTTVHFKLHGYIPAQANPGQLKLTWMAVMSDGTVAVADMQTDGLKVTITE